MTIEPHPCEDCIGLVGADARKEPHSDLDPVPETTFGLSMFRCAACNVKWISGLSGWSRLGSG
jgi:hypothetical protein